MKVLASGGLMGQCRSRGQALMVAVLLMMAILLVGILFVSVVAYNQEQSTRASDTASAQGLADAGVKYADQMLQQSALGADWRPSFRAAVGTESATDPSTWAFPPAMYNDGTVDYGFWGPDGVQGTDDDYYSQDEIDHGWCPLRAGTVATPGNFQRFGFNRYPDVVSRATDTVQAFDNAALGTGHFLLRVTYEPNPPFQSKDLQADGGYPPSDPNSKYIKIEAVGHVAEAATVFRRVTAYKPIALTDYLFFVTDKTSTGRPANLGFNPWVDMTSSGTLNVDASTGAGAPPLDQRGDFLVASLHGPIKTNVPLNFEGDSLFHGVAPYAADYSSVQISLTALARSIPAEMVFGYLRDDVVEAAGGLRETNPGGVAIRQNTGAATTLSLVTDSATAATAGFDTIGGRVRDGVNGLDANGNSRFSKRLAPPEIFTTSATTGDSRYHALTRDSGATGIDSGGRRVNTGRYGFGEGIYIDNYADAQFASYDASTGAQTHDLNALMDDWTRNLSPRDPRADDSGWNATYTTYAPRGVEIEFFPTEAATLGYGTYTPDVAAAPTDPNDPTQLWWPGHASGQPGIKITRHDKRWAVGDLNPPSPAVTGSDSGRNVIILDYPRNGVILAEGNVRVKGELPWRDPAATGAAIRPQGFSVTLVSGATIYVDGQLIGPQDRYGRLDTRTGAYTPSADGVPDEDTPKIALLANDFVCLNPTQIVPQLTQGMATAAADDMANPTPQNQHWVLSPGANGQAYTRFLFGRPFSETTGDAPPSATTNPMAASRIQLIARQMGADPGPAAVSMYTSYVDGNAGTLTPPQAYDFDRASGYGGNIFRYIFAPAGSLLNFLSSAPAVGSTPQLSQPWLSPHWPTAADYIPTGGYFELNSPGATPFSCVSLTAGDPNVISLSYADPGMSAGASDYWLRNFKIQQLDSISGVWQPVGSVHARVRAIMYAQNGSWFVIPGQYFDPAATGANDARFARRYNYDISVIGAITENFTAPLNAVRDWTDKWAYPIYGAGTGWGTISYYYDETLRAPRDQARTTSLVTRTTAAGDETIRVSDQTRFTPWADGHGANWANLPKAPCLPVSPDIIYYGE